MKSQKKKINLPKKGLKAPQDLRSSGDLAAIARILPEGGPGPEAGPEGGPKEPVLLEELQESTETLHYLVCNGLNISFELWGKTLLSPAQVKALVKPLNSIETKYVLPVIGDKLAQYSPFAELGFALTLILVQKAKEPSPKKEPEKKPDSETPPPGPGPAAGVLAQ